MAKRKNTAETGYVCGFDATVTTAAAVLYKGPEMERGSKPVAKLSQGTKVTVDVISGKNCKLANGLWTRLEYLGKQ